MGLDTHNENYDESRGEQIALNVDGDKGSKTVDSTFKSGLMDFQVILKRIPTNFMQLSIIQKSTYFSISHKLMFLMQFC